MADVRFVAAITGSLKKMLEDEVDSLSADFRNAVETAGRNLQTKLRNQVRAAGLGIKLEKSWRCEIFPRANKKTLHPRSLVYSKAPKLHGAYNTGGIIIAKNGSRYLSIPSKFVPYNFSPRRKMTPVEVEAQYNRDLVFVPYKDGRKGGVLVLQKVIMEKNKRKRRYKKDTDIRLNQGRLRENVIMFTLIPSANLKKVLDIEKPEKEAEAEMIKLLLGVK